MDNDSRTVGGARWKNHVSSFEAYLEGLVLSKVPRFAKLVEAMRYSLTGDRRRLRPALCMEVTRTFGGEPRHVLPSAAAIEFIYAYSLVHDALPAMDDDPPRERPAVHEKYDQATAILAGDAFFGEALTLVIARQEGAHEQLLKVVREIATATGANGIAGGQAIDVNRTDVRSQTDAQALHTKHILKTGNLFKSSARIGAILGCADEEAQTTISEYADKLSLCFQIVDDILDTTSRPAELGESAGSDTRQEKATFVSFYGLEGARRAADEATQRAFDALSRISNDTSGLRDLALFVRHRRY